MIYVFLPAKNQRPFAPATAATRGSLEGKSYVCSNLHPKWGPRNLAPNPTRLAILSLSLPLTSFRRHLLTPSLFFGEFEGRPVTLIPKTIITFDLTSASICFANTTSTATDTRTAVEVPLGLLHNPHTRTAPATQDPITRRYSPGACPPLRPSSTTTAPSPTSPTRPPDPRQSPPTLNRLCCARPRPAYLAYAFAVSGT